MKDYQDSSTPPLVKKGCKNTPTQQLKLLCVLFEERQEKLSQRRVIWWSRLWMGPLLPRGPRQLNGWYVCRMMIWKQNEQRQPIWINHRSAHIFPGSDPNLHPHAYFSVLQSFFLLSLNITDPTVSYVDDITTSQNLEPPQSKPWSLCARVDLPTSSESGLWTCGLSGAPWRALEGS
jgi:hypothetical protein